MNALFFPFIINILLLQTFSLSFNYRLVSHLLTRGRLKFKKESINFGSMFKVSQISNYQGFSKKKLAALTPVAGPAPGTLEAESLKV